MDYDEQTPNRYSTTIRFVAIALVLSLVLLGGVYTTKRIVANMNGEGARKTATTTENPEKPAEDKSSEVASNRKAQQQKEQEEKEKQAQAQAELKKQEEIKKQEEAKKAQEAASTQPPQQGTVASTGPSSVASTGPAETLASTIAAGALGYGGAVFVRSRREARQ